MARIERRPAAILATDVSDYSALVGKDVQDSLADNYGIGSYLKKLEGQINAVVV